MLLINPPTDGVRKSGNCEVRKKSSSYIRVSPVLRDVEKTPNPAPLLCLNNSIIIILSSSRISGASSVPKSETKKRGMDGLKMAEQ
jgi:hypothetical protein